MSAKGASACDIVVLGAGVAGSAVARRLALCGARVALVGLDPLPGWEGLSARSRELLAEEDIDYDEARISGPLMRTGLWGRGRTIADVEAVFDRVELAKVLRARARDAGADDRRDLGLQTLRTEAGWRVTLRDGSALDALVLVDARGRRGEARSGPPLLAVGRKYRRRGKARAGTGIGVADSGWCWWAERGTDLWVQAVGDRKGTPAAAWIGAVAAQIPALERALDGAQPQGAAVTRTAHARLAAYDADSSRWSVGDAALALDPLTGHGVSQALRGARLVAAAIVDAGDPKRAGAGHRFIADRFAEAFASAARATAGLYLENKHRGEFWLRTAQGYMQLSKTAAPAARAPV